MTPSWLVLAAATSVLVLSAVQVWLLWRLSRMVGSSVRLEEKVGHLADALSMLTETSEAGFRAVAEELTRRAAEAPAPAARARTPIARLKAAAKKGTSIAEIAAAEHMSEGEVRLRLHLSDRARPVSRAATKEGAGDALRA
jgi:hypothetical protein